MLLQLDFNVSLFGSLFIQKFNYKTMFSSLNKLIMNLIFNINYVLLNFF